MFCEKCGNQLNPGDTFCLNCGTKVENGGAPANGGQGFRPTGGGSGFGSFTGGSGMPMGTGMIGTLATAALLVILALFTSPTQGGNNGLEMIGEIGTIFENIGDIFKYLGDMPFEYVLMTIISIFMPLFFIASMVTLIIQCVHCFTGNKSGKFGKRGAGLYIAFVVSMILVLLLLGADLGDVLEAFSATLWINLILSAACIVFSSKYENE